MAKDPSERFASAEEFGHALQAARQQQGLDPGRMVVARVPGQVQTPGAAAAGDAGVTLSKTVPVQGADAPTALSPAVVAPGAAVPPSTAAPYVVAGATGEQAAVGGPPGAAAPSGRKGALVAAIAVVVVLVLGGAAFALFGGGTESADDPDPSTSTTAAPADYTEEVEANFIDACREQASERFNFRDARDVCGCTFEKIREDIPFRDFQAVDQNPEEGGDLREQISGFSAECIEELGLDES